MKVANQKQINQTHVFNKKEKKSEMWHTAYIMNLSIGTLFRSEMYHSYV